MRFLILLSLAPACAGVCAYAQRPAAPRATISPLNRPYGEIVSFSSVRDTLARAGVLEEKKNLFQARDEYLSVAAQLRAFQSGSFDVQALLASAEIDAARVTFALAGNLPGTNESVYQNRREVIQHAHNAVIAASTAYKSAPGPDVSSTYKCTMFRIAGQAQFLEGLAEANRDTMLKSAGFYERALACDPSDRERIQKTISFIRSHANEKRNDQLEKLAGQISELAGWRGKIAQLVVDLAYNFHKEHRESPFAREAQ